MLLFSLYHPVEPLRALIIGLTFAASCCLTTLSRAQDSSLNRAVHAHLDSGEFGLAQDLAGSANSIEQRDNLLRQIVAAQAAAGMFQASLSSSSSIQSDEQRSAAYDELASTPIGVSGLRTVGSRGGAALADFDSLIELIESTIAPDTWDTVGGPGAVEPFPGGVFVDASGLMKRIAIDEVSTSVLAATRERAKTSVADINIRRVSALRKVSITKLERELQWLWASGKTPRATMTNLAGLQRIEYIFVYPDTQDIVIAGPASGWTTNVEGRSVSETDGSPILQLDDLVVALRNAYEAGGRFGCSITPTKDNLASVQDYLRETAAAPLKPYQRDKWIAGVRSRLGQQDIVVFGIDARSRAAQVLVEADYRMKLVGMGLEPGTVGVTSYLDSIEIPKGGSPPATTVLRWWFALNYDSVRSTKAGDAFSLHGPGVKVLSENELLTERGERVHTGESDALNAQFAQSFTKHFDGLAKKYPIYAELRNVFDLALVAAVVKSQDLPGQVDWQLLHLLDDSGYAIDLRTAATKVDTVMNHRVIDRKHIVVGVSGGVSVDTSRLLQQRPIKQDEYGQLSGDRETSGPGDSSHWWWD